MNNPMLNRRKFLDWTGWMAGGALAAPFLPSTTQAAGPATRIGLLLPGAANQPGPAASFARAMPYGFRSAGRPVDLALVENCSTPAGAAAGLTPLLQDGLRLFVWLSDSPVSTQLRDVLAENGAILLMSGAGANLPRAADDNPYIHTHTLGLWQAAWGLGAWAARNLGERASMVSSLYEAGFDHLYAFQLGFESAGGEVLRTHVTGLRTGDLGHALAQVKKDAPAFTTAFYSREETPTFLRAYREAGLGSIPLAGPGFLTGEDLLAESGSSAAGIYTALGWGSGLANPQAWAFNSAYRRELRVTPGPFDLLGYEAASLVDAALRRFENGQVSSLNSAFTGLAITTPRGELRHISSWQQFSGPVYLRQVRVGLYGAENSVLATLAAPPTGDAALRALRTSLKTGWSSAYLYL